MPKVTATDSSQIRERRTINSHVASAMRIASTSTPPPTPPLIPPLRTQKVIPNFRDAAASALGERWASTPSGWYAPWGDKTPYVPETAADDDSQTSSLHTQAPPLAAAPPATPRAGTKTEKLASPSRNTSSSTTGVESGTNMAPASEPACGVNYGGGRGSGRSNGIKVEVKGVTAKDRGQGAQQQADRSGRRPFTTERNQAEDLAEYLGVRKANSNIARDIARGVEDGGVGGGGAKGMNELLEGKNENETGVNQKVPVKLWICLGLVRKRGQLAFLAFASAALYGASQ